MLHLAFQAFPARVYPINHSLKISYSHSLVSPTLLLVTPSDFGTALLLRRAFGLRSHFSWGYGTFGRGLVVR